MTVPLWSLLAFVAWTTALVLTLVSLRTARVLRGQARANDFPAGIPHGSDAYWRLNRAHLNCLEFLPGFAAVVLIAAVAGLRSSTFDTLALLIPVARVAQSCMHLLSGSDPVVRVRFTFFLMQTGCLVVMMLVLATSAGPP